MKSKTSFFNPTVFKKDLQRFAPAWGLCLLLLLLGLVAIWQESSVYYQASFIVELVPIAGLFGMLYGPLAAQLLFGDLYSARMCNALHAMPLRRECWFFTHVISGLCFAWVPCLIVAVLGLLVLDLGAAWTVIPLLLLIACLQYLFFFGLSVFCAMLVGNRFSQIIVYGIINFFSLLAYRLADSLYEPLLSGVRISPQIFELFCPISVFLDSYNMISLNTERILDAEGYWGEYKVLGVLTGSASEWVYLAVCALIGIALLALALKLYQKRDLETAGDFVAFPFMEPVFLVFFTLSAGGFAYLFTLIFGLQNMGYLLLAVGLAAGFFAGLMLLKRTTRVFHARAFLRLGLLAGVIALSLLLTALDPLGITRIVPGEEEVSGIYFSDAREIHYSPTWDLTVTNPADIEKLVNLHSSVVEEGEYDSAETGVSLYSVPFSLQYTLADGSTLSRFYTVGSDTAAAQTLKEFYSRFECIMDFPAEEIPAMAKQVTDVYINGTRDSTVDTTASLDIEGLLNAIAADCAAGNMAQFSAYHYRVTDGHTGAVYLEIAFKTGLSYTRYRSFNVYADCANTLQWLEENGLYDPAALLG